MAWSNWSGTVRCAPRVVHEVRSEAELAERVREAGRADLPVRVAGSGHSHTPLVASEGLLLSLAGMTGLEACDPRTRRATVAAGTVLRDLGEALHAHGLAMENLGDVDVQALAGALATGTHGTGRKLGGLATQVEALRLVGADGAVVSCSREVESALFEMARVSLGVLGAVSAVTLRLLPAYRLHERVLREDVETCLARFPARADAHRHCEFFWLPAKDVCEVKLLDPTPAPPDPLPERRYERIGHSHHVLPSVRDVRFVEMEYALPASAGEACFRALRARMQARHPEVQWPVELRTVAPDDIPLSPACGRETVTISVHEGHDRPWRGFFADVEPLLLAHGGRPHWGKWHTLRADRLRALYPRWDEFLVLREARDPEGRFLTPYLRALLGVG